MSEPYYQDDKVTLYHGDCREITEWLTADVLVTDPPYGIAYASEYSVSRPRKNRSEYRASKAVPGDETTMERDLILALWGASPAVCFGRWDAPRPVSTRARLIWDKGNSPGMGDLKFPWGRSDEEIYVIGEGFNGTRSGSVLRVNALVPGSAARPDHPTPKPVALLEQLIAKCPLGTIADPFTGSGSTLLAARLQHRTAIGVEIEERYCELAARRLSQDILPFGEVS